MRWGSECGHFRQWKHGQKNTREESVSSQSEKLFRVVMSGECQVGCMTMNGSLGLALRVVLKTLDFNL